MLVFVTASLTDILPVTPISFHDTILRIRVNHTDFITGDFANAIG
jgi:hypothetical protein